MTGTSAPGAQTKRQGDAGSVRALLSRVSSPAAFVVPALRTVLPALRRAPDRARTGRGGAPPPGASGGLDALRLCAFERCLCSFGRRPADSLHLLEREWSCIRRRPSGGPRHDFPGRETGDKEAQDVSEAHSRPAATPERAPRFHRGDHSPHPGRGDVGTPGGQRPEGQELPAARRKAPNAGRMGEGGGGDRLGDRAVPLHGYALTCTSLDVPRQ
jgi:hypothetical protein